MKAASIAAFTNVGFKLNSRRFDAGFYDMTGKTVVVTGASSGLGRESARTLARNGARVIIVGRNPSKLRSAQIEDDVAVEVADLSLLSEVRSLARRLLDSEDRIDVLINNVGVLLPRQEFTAEGLDTTFATNVAGQFLLTNLLLPRMASTGNARVINVSSGGMYTQRIDPDGLDFDGIPYSGTAAYAQTKRAQVILTEMWAERIPGQEVVFHSMHPGWARTPGVARSLPLFNSVMRPFLRTPEQGADTIVWLASAPEPGSSSGSFWFDRKRVPKHMTESTRETPKDRADLWSRLVETTGTDVLVSQTVH